MAAATIDYDKLAQQHGGTAVVDYDALAAQHGGAAASAPATQPPAPPSLLDRAKAKFDELTTVTPEQKAGHGAIVNAAQEFGAGAIQGLAAPIVHPLDTLNSIGHMVAHPIDSAVAMGKSAMANPAQAAGNLVGGALLGEGAAGAASAVNKVASPLVGRAVLLGKTPAEAYESALKPSTTLSEAQRAAAVQTGLKNEIPISKGGAEKLGDLIDEYNQKIKGVIDSDPTRPIDPNTVATRADAAKAKFANQVNAQPDLDAIEASKQQFLKEQGALPQAGIGAPPMNASDAQAMKQGTYQVLKGKFGEQGSASVEAQKALARGLKEEIANQFPEISNLNATESKLLDLQPVLERAVNRISNHQLIGIGTPIAGAAAKAITGSAGVGVVASTLKGVLDNPFVKSKLAISLSKGAGIPYAQAAARIGAYSAALGSASETPEN